MKTLVACLALGMLVWGPLQSEADQEITRSTSSYRDTTDTANWRQEQCRFQGLDKGVWTQPEEDRTAWCVLKRWSVPGGLTKFRAVISCESGWWRLAYNALGPYVGLAQHALASWYYRVKSYTPTWWHLRPGWRNSRTQLIVTARMVRDVGWGPWACAS
jgi:hypothetical protein